MALGRVVNEAKELVVVAESKAVDIPVFKPLTHDECPMGSEVKEIITKYQLLLQQFSSISCQQTYLDKRIPRVSFMLALQPN